MRYPKKSFQPVVEKVVEKWLISGGKLLEANLLAHYKLPSDQCIKLATSKKA